MLTDMNNNGRLDEPTAGATLWLPFGTGTGAKRCRFTLIYGLITD